ncbi:MAG TPA: hypothetical protein VMU17_05225 [Elusimicrobiota bacterium]|nr:hypothetical protein [Elusimicrobiota bacterium]
MPAAGGYRKRRIIHGPNKNELKVSRSEAETRAREQAGTLRERFPTVRRLEVDVRMVTAADVILEQFKRVIGADEPLLLNLPCQGGCGNGEFLLSDAIENMLGAQRDHHEGMGICQGTSYRDPTQPCGTKLYYRIDVSYS